MRRRLEPELMEDPAQVAAYAQADFSEPNGRFLQLLEELVPEAQCNGRVLDLGCGPGDIPLRLLKRYPQARCDALDGSRAMLDQAEAALSDWPGLAARCRWIHAVLPSEALPKAAYDLVISNSLLHHLPDPQVLWQTIRETANPGAWVLVMDLMRPPSVQWVEALVATYGAEEPEILQRDFRNSLFAAFEPQEVVTQLQEAGLPLEVGRVSDRHLAVWGRLEDAHA